MLALGHLQALYHRHFNDSRREDLFLSSRGFFTTFASARGFAHEVKRGIGPLGNVSAEGVHIHHSAWGILALITVGSVWLLRLGAGGGSRWGSRGTSFAYGADTALTLDELDLWLLQEDKYWKNKGRMNVDAVLLTLRLPPIGHSGRQRFPA